MNEICSGNGRLGINPDLNLMNAAKDVFPTKRSPHMIFITCHYRWNGWSRAADADPKGLFEESLAVTDQSNDPADIKMTADIRKMVVDDDSLSMAAKNVKIITIAGVVTLRGPVNTRKRNLPLRATPNTPGPSKSPTNSK